MRRTGLTILLSLFIISALATAGAAERESIPRWIGDLAGDDYRPRRTAMEALRGLGLRAVGPVLRALRGPIPHLEYQRRLELLVAPYRNLYDETVHFGDDLGVTLNVVEPVS